ncbi:MAG: hypothetical protein QM723_27425 [Myxococcaceae bacterium]
MEFSFFILVSLRWLATDPKAKEALLSKNACFLGVHDRFPNGCRVLLKFRSADGVATEDGRIERSGKALILKGRAFMQYVRPLIEDPNASTSSDSLIVFIEGSGDEARCIISKLSRDALQRIDGPERLSLYALPPVTGTLVDAESLVQALQRITGADEPDLFSIHVDRFINAPHIITSLFAHLQSVRASDAMRFPVVIKTLADQLRAELLRRTDPPRIVKITKNHVDTWADVQGKALSFADGGAARIAGLPGLSPMAIRVGVYTVRPGERDADRERFSMRPFVVGDSLDRERRPREAPDPRRLQEAARYTMEPLAGLLHLEQNPDVVALFTHGPLVNQFAQYDEGEPNFIPFLAPEFLGRLGITRDKICGAISNIPTDSTSDPLWNQFMAVYAYVMKQVDEHVRPIVGVVERPTGRAVTLGILRELEAKNVFTTEYRTTVERILDQYDVTDDFLFGCVLQEGEFVTPVEIVKNIRRKARERWWPVVAQMPNPHALLLKSEETNFPFRVELNKSATQAHSWLARLLYHTARLLPRYAFPVGLDIADKYAKIPDWLSKGISAELAATLLRRALATGDPRQVAALRLFLARGPRDFFYRPQP